MKIDIEAIKRLKDLSGAGLTDAKKALEVADGDFDKALSEMRKKGLTKAEKRSEREARAGIIGTYNHDNRIGVLVEVNCETDFVARNDLFITFVKDIAMQIAAINPMYISIKDVPKKNIDEITDEKILLNQEFIKDSTLKVEGYLKQTAAKLGENIVIRRFSRFELGETN